MPAEWEHGKYGSAQRAVLAPGLHLEVVQPIGTKSGPAPKWKTTVFGATLKAEFDDAEAAKAAAERVGRKWLAEASAKLS